MTAASSSRAAVSVAALACGVDDTRQPQRTFADPDGKLDWKEYLSVERVPTLTNDTGARYAVYWTASDGKVLVMLEESGQDFEYYTHYCFGKTGELLSLRFELRTAWGWGFRREGPMVNGIWKPTNSGYIDTDGDKPIPRLSKRFQATHLQASSRSAIRKFI